MAMLASERSWCYRDHISTAAGNDFRDFLQLARFVCQGNGETDVSSAGQKPPGNHAAENIDVNVSAGDDTNHLFPFYRQFMKQDSGNTRRRRRPLRSLFAFR